MKCHIGVFIFYLIIGIFVIIASRVTEELIVFAIFMFLLTLIHGLLAYGSYKKIEISRKISEFIFALCLLAFPVGTFLAIYLFLPATQWCPIQTSNNQNQRAARRVFHF